MRPNQNWNPIVGIDQSVYRFDPVKQKYAPKMDFDNSQSPQDDGLRYHKSFDVPGNNNLATKQFKEKFDLSP